MVNEFITGALARGMTLELIQRLLGHSNISTSNMSHTTGATELNTCLFAEF
jgi:site-specific recombinase XerD